MMNTHLNSFHGLDRLIMDKLRIPHFLLSPRIDIDTLGFADTTELPPLEEPLGQARALEALDFGLNMKSHGFNIYASGPIGTGKWSIIHKRVQQVALAMPAPGDWCYVHNFLEPTSPLCLSFASGKGREFKQAMNHVIQSLRRDLPLAFESKKYLDARAKIVQEQMPEVRRQTIDGLFEGCDFERLLPIVLFYRPVVLEPKNSSWITKVCTTP